VGGIPIRPASTPATKPVVTPDVLAPNGAAPGRPGAQAMRVEHTLVELAQSGDRRADGWRADPGSATVWTVPDDDPLPTTAPRAPRLERVLAWLTPGWARRRAARAARHQQSIAGRLTRVADDRRRARDGATPRSWLRPRVRTVGGYRIPD